MRGNVSFRTKYNDIDGGCCYFLALIIPVAIGLLATIILGAIGNAYGIADFSKNAVLYSIYIAICSLSLVGLYFIYNRVAKVNYIKASLVKFKFGWLNLAICVVIALVMLFGFNLLVNYLSEVMANIGYNPDASLPLPLTNGWWLVINLVVLALLPAICEEIVYRGIILNGLRKLGTVNAVLISGLFFALAHGSAMQLIYQFILGAVIGFVVIKTGSIIAGMVVHFINNATVIIVNYCTGNSQMIFDTNKIILAFVIAIVAAGILLLLIWALKEKKTEDATPNQEYFEIYNKENQGFSEAKSKLFFFTSLAISIVLWCLGTFL